MKKLLLLSILLLGVFSLSQAQRNTGERPSQSKGESRPERISPEERIEREVKQLKDTLALTDEQAVKVKEIYSKNEEKRRAAFEKARESGEEPDREAMRKEMMAAMEAQNTEIKAVLTNEQKVKFESYLKARQERMKNWQGRGDGQRPPTE